MTARPNLAAPERSAPERPAPERIEPSPSKFEKKRENVLAAAAAIFNREGVRGATLSDVAAAVDLNIKSLRYYFTRKDDLAAAAFLRAIEVYGSLIAEASKARSVEDRIARLIDFYFRLTRDVATGAATPFLHFGDLRSLAEPQAGPVFSAFNDMFRALRRLIATPKLEADGRPALNARTHLLLSQMLWSVIWTQRYEPEDLPRASERMVDILIHGLAAHPGLWAPAAPQPPAPLLPVAEGDPGRLSQPFFLRAATVLINAHGYKGASIDRIAASLNVTKGAFYHYHDAKDELVVACFERTFQMMRSAQALSRTRPTSFARLADSACLLVRHQLTEEGPLLRTSALTAVPEPIRSDMTLRLDRVTSRFADAVTDGMIDGTVRLCDAAIAAQMITATINSAEELPRWVAGVGPDTAAALYARPTFLGLHC